MGPACRKGPTGRPAPRPQNASTVWLCVLVGCGGRDVKITPPSEPLETELVGAVFSKESKCTFKKIKMLETMVLPKWWGLGGFSCNVRPNMVNFRRVSTRSFKKLKKSGSCREVPCWLPGDRMNAWPQLRTITSGC